jgi:hypothetical protein
VVTVLENISLLLNEALTPYQVNLGSSNDLGDRHVWVMDSTGKLMFERLLNRSQFNDNRALTDIVDGFQRDLRVAEGRLQPCAIAASQNAALSRNLHCAVV